MFNALKDWNSWWEKKEFITDLAGIPRTETSDIEKYSDEREIKIITGVRRSGKSTIMYQIIDHLLKKEIKPDNILLINLEDRRLKSSDIEDIFNLYQRELNPPGKLYVFIDEIQNAVEWEYWIKKKYDLSRNISFFITGSCSSLLKNEYSTLLTGRNIQFDIMPLSFREFLNFKGFHIKDIRFVTTPTRNKLLNTLGEYLKYGGFPEIVLKENSIRFGILNQYFDDIINKDVVARYDLSSVKAFDLSKYLLSNVGNFFSFRTARAFTGFGMETLEKYLSRIMETYLVHLVPMFSYSMKEQMQYPRKIYCIDTGLRNAVSFKFSEDKGRLSENLVFIELKRRYKQPISGIYYWKHRGGMEVDFVIKEGLKINELIQVCWDVSDTDTKKREIRSLLKAMDEFKLKEGLVITEDFEGKEKVKGKSLLYKPLWKWLLE